MVAADNDEFMQTALIFSSIMTKGLTHKWTKPIGSTNSTFPPLEMAFKPVEP